MEYIDVIAAGARSLAENEFWCVYHPDGPLPDTASKRLDVPIVVTCKALDADWDDLQEAGFYLGKWTKPADPTP